MSAPTKRQLAARHVRRLRTMRRKVLDMACEWEDMDEFCISKLTELADHVEEVAISLVEEEEVK